MKMNCIINPARILNRFGKAWLIKRANRKHELVGGTADDCTEAKEWASLSAHEIVFTRSVMRILSIRREMIVVSAMG
jgi:hypothetical protein